MSKYKGKNVLVVGFGLSGVATAKYMAKQGAKVLVTDQKQKSELSDSVNACADLKIDYELGKHNNKSFHTAELIVVSPGVPLNIKPLEEARELKVQTISEIDLAVGGIKEPIIAVTGTNGKTTVTTLIGEMFKEDNRPVFVGGNIGKPLLDYVSEGQRVDAVVAELSSFQLELTEKLIPAVAVFTNVEPDHMDRYSDFSAYIDAKKRLLKACDRNTYVVLNYDCPTVSQFANDCNGRIMWFTKKDPLEVGGTFAENFVGAYYKASTKQIIARINGREEIYDLSAFKLFGEHNKENLMAAICAARAMGINPKAIQSVIAAFKGVPRRTLERDVATLVKKRALKAYGESKARVYSLTKCQKKLRVVSQ